MLSKRNIVWLVSYPKSGNTWFRIFLNHLMSESKQPLPLNETKNIPIVSSRVLFDHYAGVNSSDLTDEEIENLRPDVYCEISNLEDGTLFFKTHDAWKLNSNKKSIFPKEITKGVIYIIRNPLDVVVSYSYHRNRSIDDTIEVLNDSGFALSNKKSRLSKQLKQDTFSWSGHVKSWVEKSNLPVHVMRYEDMHRDPFKSFHES